MTLTPVSQVVQRLGDYWASCAQLRSQLKLVAIKYPLSVEIPPPAQDGTSGFNAIATIIFPNVKAKAFVSFKLDLDTFSSWPMSIRATKCEAEAAYGPIERVFTCYYSMDTTDDFRSQTRHNPQSCYGSFRPSHTCGQSCLPTGCLY